MKYIIIATGVLAAVYGLLICVYLLTKPEIQSEWDDRIQSKCGVNNPNILKSAYGARSLRDFGECAVGFGSYFGLLFASAAFHDHPSTTKEHTFFQTIGWALIAYLLYLAGTAFIYLPGTDNLDQVSGMILKKFIPTFWETFSLSALSWNLASSIGLFKGIYKKTYTRLFEFDIELQNVSAASVLVIMPTNFR